MSIEPESDSLMAFKRKYRPNHARLHQGEYQISAELTEMKNANGDQREADRIASEKNPPKPPVPEPTGQEMSYAERLKYRDEKVKGAGQQEESLD